MPARRPSRAASLAAFCATFALAQMAHAQPIVAPNAMARLAEADANRDGRVTRDEFIAARAVQFERFDRNRDGVLTLADSPPRFIAERLGVDLPAMLKMFDANKDAKVTRAEFDTGPTPAFDAADADKSGVLDTAELNAARKAR